MRLVGEHDLERQQLGRLIGVEVYVQVVHRHVEVGELDLVVHLAHTIEAVVVDRQAEPVGQIDFVVAHRAEEVHVEEEHFEQRRNGDDDDEADERLLEQPVARIEGFANLLSYFPAN